MSDLSPLVVSTGTRRRSAEPSAFTEAPVGLAVLDLAGLVDDANPAFCDLLGVERGTILGRPFGDFVAGEKREELDRRLSRLVLGTSRSARIDALRLCVGDRQIEADLSAARRERDGGAIGFIVSAWAARHAPVADAALAQAQKMQAIGQLAGGIAHDFNNLLTAMLGFSELLLTRHAPGEPSYDDIVEIHRNAERAAGLVRQLLAFSRQQTLAPVVLDPTAAIAELSLMLARLLGPAIELRLESSGEPTRIRVDPVQFDQVIVNLAVNARDAMPHGGTLTIGSRPVLVDAPRQAGEEIMPPGDYVLIEVGDTGIGIVEDILGNIFEPFFTTKEAGAGTGLGLSTVHGIIRQTDGFVLVDSALGHGTTFSMYLPAVAATRARPAGAVSRRPNARPATPPALEQQAQPATILLVEDEPGVRAFAARVLRRDGHRVLAVGDGEEALRIFEEGGERIDLLVSDIVMPGMDGHTLARLLGKRLGGVPVIFMSGYAEDLAPDGPASAHFLMKPFTLAELADKVTEVLAAPPANRHARGCHEDSRQPAREDVDRRDSARR